MGENGSCGRAILFDLDFHGSFGRYCISLWYGPEFGHEMERDFCLNLNSINPKSDSEFMLDCLI